MRQEKQAGEAASEQIHYFDETNKERMRYSEYRAGGYPIGSGTVESACKRLIGARLKGSRHVLGELGEEWSARGADVEGRATERPMGAKLGQNPY